MESYLTRVGLGAGINLAFLVPLFALAFLLGGKGKSAVKPVLLFAALFVLDMACIWSFKLAEFIPAWGKYNWQGKVLETAWPVLLAFTVPTFAAARIGLTLPAERRGWRMLLIAAALYLALGVPVMLLMGAHFGVDGGLPTFL